MYQYFLLIALFVEKSMKSDFKYSRIHALN